MIKDTLQNRLLYHGVHAGISTALEYLATTDFTDIAPGRYPVDGDRIYASVESYNTRLLETSSWEAHRSYIDVQYIIAGTEIMGCAPLDSLEVTVPYDTVKDAMRLAGDGDFLTVPAGTFAVFFPHDAHMPCLAVEAPAPVRKVVVKVSVNAA